MHWRPVRLPPLVAGEAGTPSWWLGAAVAAGTAAGMLWLAVRARTARPRLTAALEQALGPQAVAQRRRRKPCPLVRLLVLPLVSYRFDVRRVANLRYGRAGRGHLLDVYLPRSETENAPLLVYLHGGGFRVGSKNPGGHPLLYGLADRSWVCVSVNYRLGGGLDYADRLTTSGRSCGGCARTPPPTGPIGRRCSLPAAPPGPIWWRRPRSPEVVRAGQTAGGPPPR